jgi:tritrans,polycis-undecaprenyl-diphosphate synthase [geranylgeranyl-diphosphate specific]
MDLKLFLLRLFLQMTKAYSVYEWYLLNQIKNGKTPKHIGIIVDGNRRWARENWTQNRISYAIGADRLEHMLDWSLELNIESVTLYVLSTENLQRKRSDLDDLFSVIEERLWKLYNDKRLDDRQIRVKAIGEIDVLPYKIRHIISKLEEKTSKYSKHYLNIAIAYGGRVEMVECMRKIASKVYSGELKPSDISERLIEQYLYTCHLPNPDPDLILRTSGEERLSGFLLWQSAYSELFFIDSAWPDFRRIDFLRAIRSYQTRQRRFGK